MLLIHLLYFYQLYSLIYFHGFRFFFAKILSTSNKNSLPLVIFLKSTEDKIISQPNISGINWVNFLQHEVIKSFVKINSLDILFNYKSSVKIVYF